jgi:ABC-type phosphate/phosphonate transport system substrate-binding protein
MESAPVRQVTPAFRVARGPAFAARSALATFLCLGAWVQGRGAVPEPAIPVVRIGISPQDVGRVNRADLLAALKVWVASVTVEGKPVMDPRPVFLGAPAEAVQEIRQRQLDVIILPTEEFLEVERQVPLVNLFSTQVDGRITAKYVLLVRTDSPVRHLRDLAGQTLAQLEVPRNALAPIWLDAELLAERLPPASRLFAKITRTDKGNLAILPVFFGQATAALTSRSSFDLACELNPQLAKDLRVLAESPELVPTLCGYCPDSDPAIVYSYSKRTLHLAESTAGRMILSLFQIDGVVEVRPEDIAGTRAFLKRYQQLKADYERRSGK